MSTLINLALVALVSRGPTESDKKKYIFFTKRSFALVFFSPSSRLKSRRDEESLRIFGENRILRRSKKKIALLGFIFFTLYLPMLRLRRTTTNIKIKLSCGDSNTDCKYQKFMIYPLIDRI